MGSMVLVKKNAPCMDGQWYLGHPLPGREMRLAEDGEIWVRGSTRFDGYLDCDPLPPNAWFPTKDIGRFDPEKGFAILGRKDWQFISRGENIQPEEIEREILQIPGVLEAIVIPQKNPEYGTVPVAIVQSLHKDLTLNQITEYLSASLPKYKIPKGLHAVETFPRIGNKIDRKKVILNYS
jgi:O-succinylbenzoic acid--CoA ligase